MAEPEVLTEARRLIEGLDEWEGPSNDWRRLEAKAAERVEDLLAVLRWLAEQVIDADGRVLSVDVEKAARRPVREHRPTRSFGTAKDQLADIGRFDMTESNEARFREILSTVEGSLQQVWSDAGWWACQHAVRRTDKPTGKVAEQLREAEEKLKRIRKHEGAARAARDGAMSAAAKAGAAVFTDSFRASADGAQSASQRWLIAGLVSALVTMGVALWLVLGEPGGRAKAWLWLQPFAGRLFLLSILTYVTVWCGRRSLAERHNSRVNLHRANSIQTIQAFRESANAEATKDAVVLEAARAIFENVQTGDLGVTPDNPAVARTMELVRPLGDSRA